MNKETLKQIKKEYEEINKIANGDFSEIAELEQNPVVQRYRHLLDLKESCYGTDKYYKESHVWNEIITKFSNGIIDPTNNIWFWYEDMQIRSYEELFHRKLETENKNQLVSVYVDLENSSKIITVPIEEQHTFESTNKVIRGNRLIEDAEDRYYNTRVHFFQLCAFEGQDLAIEKILTEEQDRMKEGEELTNQRLAELKKYLDSGLIDQKEYEQKKKQLSLKNK